MQSKQLKKLQQTWQRKLERSGFEDVERPNGTLKNYDSYRLREMNMTGDVLQARQRYYELARHFYNDHTFETSLEKEVWRLHSEGVTYKEIVKAIKRRVSWSSVQRIVVRLAKLMLSQRVGALDDRD